jgi:hypothetical protein
MIRGAAKQVKVLGDCAYRSSLPTLVALAREPDGEDFIVECGNDSGGKALSYHAISVLGLIAVAGFW